MYVSKSACDLTVHEIRVVLLALSRSFLPSIFGLDPKLYELRLPTVEECLLIHSEYALALQERRLLDGSGKVLLDDVFVFKNEKDALSVAGHGEGSFDKNYAFVVAPKRAMDTPPEVLSAMGLKVGNVFPVTKEL
jgi:hypothetical protein